MNANLRQWRRNRGSVPAQRQEANPFLDLHREMTRLFDDFFGDFEGALKTPGWGLARRPVVGELPQLDIAETENEVTVTADLPGLTEKDVEVALDEDVLTIKGQRSEEKEEKRRNYHVMERSYGEFHRVVPLPSGVDPDKAAAVFKNGVLKLTLPKKLEAKTNAKKIAITSA